MATTYTIERIVCGASGAITIAGVKNVRLDRGLAAVLDSGSSMYEPTNRAITGVYPVVGCDTVDVKTVADATFGTAGSSNNIPTMAIGTAGSSTLYVYIQKVTEGGSRPSPSTATNHRLVIRKGTLTLNRISGGTVAVANLTINAVWDGTNAPVQIESGVALSGSSATPASPALWRCAAVLNNATAINKITDWSIDFNVAYSQSKPQSTVFASDGSVEFYAPTARFSTQDFSTCLTSTPIIALATISGAGVRFVLGKYDPTGVGMLTSTTGLVFSFVAQSAWWAEPIDLGPGIKTITCNVVGASASATSPPVTYDTAIAVPADGGIPTRYMTGPVKDTSVDSSTAVERILDGTFDNGLEVKVDRVASVPWPVSVWAVSHKPSIRFRTRDEDYYQALSGGTAGTANTTHGRVITTSFVLYFRAHTVNLAPAANSATVHLTLTFSAGYVEPMGIGGGHGDDWEGEVLVTRIGGTFTIAEGVAIP